MERQRMASQSLSLRFDGKVTIALVCFVVCWSFVSFNCERSLLEVAYSLSNGIQYNDETSNGITEVLKSLETSILENQQTQNVEVQVVSVLAGDSIYERQAWDLSPIVLEKYKLIFFTVPKVACTVWKTLFRRMMGFEEDVYHGNGFDLHNPQRNGLKYLTDYNLTYATHLMNSPEYTRAMFVRDPKERILSAYKEKIVRTGNSDFIVSKCCKRKSIDKMNKPSFCDSAPPKGSRVVPFAEFVEIAKVCDNAHWRPQSNRMEKKYYSKLNFIGHLDTIQQDAKALLQRVGAWEKYGKTGWGKNKDESLFQSTSAVSHKTNAHDSLTKFYKFPELEDAVEELYAADYSHPLLGFTNDRITASS